MISNFLERRFWPRRRISEMRRPWISRLEASENPAALSQQISATRPHWLRVLENLLKYGTGTARCKDVGLYRPIWREQIAFPLPTR